MREPIRELNGNELKTVYYRNEGLTFKAIGEIIGVTPERVRQIYNKSIRKIKYKIKEAVLSKEVKEEINEVDPVDYKIIDINLSVREFNGLRMYGVKTVQEVLNLYKTGEIENIKNLGKKSIREIKRKIRDLLESKGLNPDMYLSKY